MKRVLFALALALMTAAFYATPALADGTVVWTGNGAANNTACEGEEEPGFHWIFAPGGNDSVTAATLTVTDANDTETIEMEQSGEGSWAADSDGDAAVISASVDFVGSTGQGGGVLTLSHGCFAAEVTPPPPPGPQPPGPPPPPPPGGGVSGSPPPPGAPLGSPPPPAAPGGALPFTGLPVWMPLLAGAALLGSGLVLLRRRREVES